MADKYMMVSSVINVLSQATDWLIKDDETSFTVTEFGRKFIDIVG